MLLHHGLDQIQLPIPHLPQLGFLLLILHSIHGGYLNMSVGPCFLPVLMLLEVQAIIILPCALVFLHLNQGRYHLGVGQTRDHLHGWRGKEVVNLEFLIHYVLWLLQVKEVVDLYLRFVFGSLFSCISIIILFTAGKDCCFNDCIKCLEAYIMFGTIFFEI